MSDVFQEAMASIADAAQRIAAEAQRRDAELCAREQRMSTLEATAADLQRRVAADREVVKQAALAREEARKFAKGL